MRNASDSLVLLAERVLPRECLLVAFDKSDLDSLAGNPTLTRLCRPHRVVRLAKTLKWIVISDGLRVHSTWHVAGAHQARVSSSTLLLTAIKWTTVLSASMRPTCARRQRRSGFHCVASSHGNSFGRRHVGVR